MDCYATYVLFKFPRQTFSSLSLFIFIHSFIHSFIILVTLLYVRFSKYFLFTYIAHFLHVSSAFKYSFRKIRKAMKISVLCRKIKCKQTKLIPFHSFIYPLFLMFLLHVPFQKYFLVTYIDHVYWTLLHVSFSLRYLFRSMSFSYFDLK